MAGELGRHVELPAELADIGQAAGAQPRMAEVDLAAGGEGEALVREILRRQALQQRPRVRPHQRQHRRGRGDVVEKDARALGQMAPQPGQVAALRDGEGHHHELGLGKPGDGDVGLDPAELVQPLGVDHPAHAHVDLVGADPVQPGAGIGAGDQVFDEAGLVEQRHVLGRVAAFLADRPEPARSAVGIFHLVPVAGRAEEARPFPARRLGHPGAGRQQPVVERAAADAAGGLELAVRPVHVEEQPQRLGRALGEVAAVALEGLHAADIDVDQLDRRAAVADPFGQRLADPARGQDADRVEAGGAEQPRDLGRLAEEVAVVGGEALGAVEEELDPGPLEQRHPAGGGLEIGGDVVDVLGQGAELEIGGDAVLPPGLGVRLEEADQQLAGILLVIGPLVAEEQNRQFARQAGDRLGDAVEMLRRMQRQRHPGLGREIARPHAAADHHRFGADRALVGHHPGGPAVLDHDARHRPVLEDPRPAHAGAAGIGLGHVGGVHLAVMGKPEAADDAVDIDRRPAFRDLARGDGLDRQAEIAAHRGAAGKFLVARRRVRHPQRAVAAEAGGQPGLGLQLGEELAGVFGELGHPPRRAQLCHQAGGMPGGAAGQPPAFAQDDIVDADPGQVVGDRAAGDAAADDHHIRPLGDRRHGEAGPARPSGCPCSFPRCCRGTTRNPGCWRRGRSSRIWCSGTGSAPRGRAGGHCPRACARRRAGRRCRAAAR